MPRNLSKVTPQTSDNYLFLENKISNKKIPEELANIVNKKISIHVPNGGFDIEKYLQKNKDTNDWEIYIPENAGIVMPGKEAKRSSVADIVKEIDTNLGADITSSFYQPDWVDYTPHPKFAKLKKARIKRINGQRLDPYYGVFGSDDRQTYYPSGYPWICIGKVLVWDDFSKSNYRWSGSAVLIGGRTVLTAGHVFPWGSKNWAIKFIPAFYDGDSALGNGVSSWVSSARGYDTDGVSAWDMAVLRLYEPLGDIYGYFGTKNYNSSWEDGEYWTLAGYPSAVSNGNRPSKQMWWPVLGDDSDGSAKEIEYEADATGGNSGGPVFGFWGKNYDPYAIATVSGGSKTSFLGLTIEDTNVGAGGGALNSLVAWARSNWV